MTATGRLVERCDNWGACLRASLTVSVAKLPGKGARYFARIGSYEQAYRSPQRNHWAPPGATAAPDQADVLDAQEVESAVCLLDLYHHTVLRGWHVYRLAEPTVLRLAAKASGTARGRNSGWDATLSMAYGLLADALLVPAVFRRERARERVQTTLAPLVPEQEGVA